MIGSIWKFLRFGIELICVFLRFDFLVGVFWLKFYLSVYR